MKSLLLAIGASLLLLGAAIAAEQPAKSGIDLQYIDTGVRAQDDFYRYVNGKWLAATEIPADKSAHDSFDIVYDRTQLQLRGIIEDLQKAAAPADAEQRKIIDLYASFMDEGALESLGLKPLAGEFARIDALQNVGQIPALIAHLNSIGVAAPLAPQVHQDNKDSTK